MVTYIDTSVIIAAVDRGNVRNKDTEKFLLREKEKIMSPLTLVEIFFHLTQNSQSLVNYLQSLSLYLSLHQN
jgi:predicted nucleic acid-binding protein